MNSGSFRNKDYERNLWFGMVMYILLARGHLRLLRVRALCKTNNQGSTLYFMCPHTLTLMRLFFVFFHFAANTRKNPVSPERCTALRRVCVYMRLFQIAVGAAPWRLIMLFLNLVAGARRVCAWFEQRKVYVTTRPSERLMGNIRGLEKTLGYKFRHPWLCMQSITHPSWTMFDKVQIYVYTYKYTYIQE